MSCLSTAKCSHYMLSLYGMEIDYSMQLRSHGAVILSGQSKRSCKHIVETLPAPQVGNYTLDNSRWERPESITGPRPVYYVTTRNGAPYTWLPPMQATACLIHLCVHGVSVAPPRRPAGAPISNPVTVT